MPYVPLHTHSVYSSYQGIMTPREIVARASLLGLGACALTDHWSTYGHFEFFDQARKAGIKPVLGAEIQHASLVGSPDLYHLTLIAETDEGYRNLCSLVSRHAGREKEPHVVPGELELHHDGIVVLTGCIKGEASRAIGHGNLGRARDVIMRLVEIFGRSNVFLEVMNHGTQRESLVADQMRGLSTKTGIPYVVTNNDRYVLREDAEHYRIARLLGKRKEEGKKREEGKRKEEGEEEEPFQEYNLKKETDLMSLFPGDREAFDLSGEIAGRCNVDLSRAGRITFAAAPNPHESLANMCRRRFLLAFHNRPGDERSYLRRAMERELESAGGLGLSDFLLFMRALFVSAMEEGIWLELMGGDLLESVVAYLLDISPLNPIDHGLVFESFSPSGYGSPAPVELVISADKKERFVEIVRALLPGYEPCFQIAQEEMSVAAIAKDILDELGAPSSLRDELSRVFAYEKRHRSLAAFLESSEGARKLYQGEPLAKTALHSAYALHGKLCRFTYDSSRLVIVPGALEGFYSVFGVPAGERFAQLSAAAVERSGGWAIGVQHSHFLSALERTVESLRGEEEMPPALNLFAGSENTRWAPGTLDDPRTFALIAEGDTAGVYLLESQGIRDHLVAIKPSSFDELVNIISLYRPGPMEGRLWEKYLGNLEKKGKAMLAHPLLAPVLAGTQGVLLYREQIREVLDDAAGLAGEDAVRVERALERGDSGDLVSARLVFIRGAMDGGLDEEEGQHIFDYLLHNAAFTHSKSLSCAQASLSYRTAFFKAHCFEWYFAALLNSNMGVKERETRYLDYLGKKGTQVLPHGINADGVAFAYEDGVIRAPLTAVVALEKGEWEAIVEERIYRGDFASFEDFLERMRNRLSMRAVLALVDKGVFDDSGVARDRLRSVGESFFRRPEALASPASVPPRAGRAGRNRTAPNQTSLFGPEGDDDPSGGARGGRTGKGGGA